MSLRRIAAAWAALAVASPGLAEAHAVERGLILLLPTEYYLAGGAVAVAVSFTALAVLPGRAMRRAFALGQALPRSRLPGSAVVQWAAFAFWAGLVVAGLTGTRDPLSNPLPLVVWTLFWIGLPTAVAVVGDIWPWLNPWAGPMRVVRLLVGPAPLHLPCRAGYWPGILSFGAVVWFEIVDIAPEDPARLAHAVIGYWAVHLVAMAAFGERRWSARGEAFSILFRLIGRLSPIAGGRLALPGARLSRPPAMPLAGWLFVIATIAGVTFDGLAGTFWWLGHLGINPLEFPGRSAVGGANTAGLIGTWVALAAAYAISVTAGWALAGRRADLRESLGRIALSLLPIALAYHLSHYLTYFLVNAQYAGVALSDPFGTGADWLGLGPARVTTSFLNNLEDVEAIWRAQVALIVGGHVLAVLIADAVADDLYAAERRGAILSQVPLAGLMVGFTLLGLWLLSAPTAV